MLTNQDCKITLCHKGSNENAHLLLATADSDEKYKPENKIILSRRRIPDNVVIFE
jgi:hypothetical protein